MRPARKFVILLFLILVIAFVGGLYRLMELRFETGDVFPPYSTLRSDPLGTKVMHQALKRLPGFSVRRHFQATMPLDGIEHNTIFFSGLDPHDIQWWSEKDMASIQQLLEQGNRLILSFTPVRVQPEETTTAKQTEEVIAKEEATDDQEACKCGLFFKELGLSFDFIPFTNDNHDWPLAQLVTDTSSASLPAVIRQRSGLHFTELDPDWQTIYQENEQAVIVERTSAGGSLVLMADSFLLSNEGLHKDRQPELFTWLLGGNQQVIFDETHLGVTQSSGVMVLIRQYRLAGFLIGFLSLAGLFLWQRMVPFVPGNARSSTAKSDEAEQMDYHVGLVNLLRRNIQAEQLLPVCLREWKKSLIAGGKGLQPQIKTIHEIINQEQAKPKRERNLPATYKRIADILAERKWLWK